MVEIPESTEEVSNTETGKNVQTAVLENNIMAPIDLAQSSIDNS